MNRLFDNICAPYKIRTCDPRGQGLFNEEADIRAADLCVADGEFSDAVAQGHV